MPGQLHLVLSGRLDDVEEYSGPATVRAHRRTHLRRPLAGLVERGTARIAVTGIHHPPWRVVGEDGQYQRSRAT
jgi:hypothetical protein